MSHIKSLRFMSLDPSRFPVIANCFPCYLVFGKRIENRQKAHKYCAIACAGGPIRLFFPLFPVFFPVMAKNDPETGSRSTACTASQSELFVANAKDQNFSRVSGWLA